MPTEKKNIELSYGPVFVAGGRHKGRVGYYDEDEGKRAFVCFGNPLLFPPEYLIARSLLREINTDILFERRDVIFGEINKIFRGELPREYTAELLYEFNLIDGLLSDRMLSALYRKNDSGKRIFISHSSLDKAIATAISVDLANSGHQPWLDSWNIKVGQSIPAEISSGLEASDVIAILLTKKSVESQWVTNEWQLKYWDEIKEKHIKVLPVLIEDCKVPYLLKNKKYADFRNDYSYGMEQLLESLEI